MSDEFDPYYQWLGIPPKHQPADHYRLLGIEQFETNTDVIGDAAERQIAHVRRKALSQHSQLSQKMLNELAGANACLLDPVKKAAYDEALQARLSAAAGAPQAKSPPRNAPAPIPNDEPRAVRGSSVVRGTASGGNHNVLAHDPIPVRAKRRSKSLGVELAKIVVGGIVGLMAATAILYFLGIDLRGHRRPSATTNNTPTAANVDPSTPSDKGPSPASAPNTNGGGSRGSSAALPPKLSPSSATDLHSFLRFASRKDHVEVDNTHGVLDLQKPFTIELTARWDTNVLDKMLYLAGDEAWPKMSDNIPVSEMSGWVIRTSKIKDSDKQAIEFNVATSAKNNGRAWLSVFTPYQRVQPDQWQHIAVCRTASELQIYWNGKLAAKQSLVGVTLCSSPSNVFIGVRRDGYKDREFVGDISSFRVSSKAIYGDAFVPKIPLTKDESTVALLDFAAGDDEQIPDGSGNKRHGLVVGAKLVTSKTPKNGPTPFVLPVLENSIGMKLAYIPSGEFQMGSPDTEEGHDKDEQQHRVRITNPFYLGRRCWPRDPGR